MMRIIYTILVINNRRRLSPPHCIVGERHLNVIWQAISFALSTRTRGVYDVRALVTIERLSERQREQKAEKLHASPFIVVEIIGSRFVR